MNTGCFTKRLNSKQGNMNIKKGGDAIKETQPFRQSFTLAESIIKARIVEYI